MLLCYMYLFIIFFFMEKPITHWNLEMKGILIRSV